jgi:biopolymer transport protein TolR
MALRKKFRRINKKRKLNAEINVVPYIDVMLVLLVIFMVTAPLLNQGVQIDLPKVDMNAFETPKIEPVYVNVDQFENISLSGSDLDIQNIELDQLSQHASHFFSDSKRERPVYIKAEKTIKYGVVVNVMARLQSLGVTNIGLLTQPEN